MIIEFIKFKNLKDLNKRRINYLILDNLEIETLKEYENNEYDGFLLKSYLMKMIKKIKEELKE